MNKKPKAEKNGIKPKIVMTRNAKLIIIIVACLVVVGLAVGLPLGLINRATVPTPEFSTINQATDYSIRVKWNKINNADGYTYQFSYGNPNDASAEISSENFTQNTITSFERHKGIVAFRVKANIKNQNTDYSSWIFAEIEEWKLPAPVVTISNKLDISWTASKFKYYDKSYNVPSYAYNIEVDGNLVNMEDLTTISNESAIKDYLIEFITNPSDMYPELVEKIYGYNTGAAWQDITIRVRVKALISKNDIMYPSLDEYASLKAIYGESEYAYATLVITEEIYNGLVTPG